MLQSIRNFSKTIWAKILLAIIIIPFVTWGMGDVFRGGNKNTIVKINQEKISTKEFIKYLNVLNIDREKIFKEKNFNSFNQILSNFIGEKLLEIESEKLGIKISEEALAELIKNEKNFQNENVFSRTKYEKFFNIK